ncbi:MAG: hypothetical protein QGI49_02320 [SAR202 cluster bacterium]|jgi:hypothetical protein|nr:hypothetical protein [SAR202 cluster bacterium]
MRRKRTIYFNDARHYYLFVIEPPMSLEHAWQPVDEIAGTSVDTFSYGVERGDGLFYPSKVGMRFGADIQPFEQAAYWRLWHNMQSLIDRGLDPLAVLIDRAHEKDMEFLASLRLGCYGDMNPAHNTRSGGRGFMIQMVRDHVAAVLDELATDYDTDGVELDFAAPPGGASLYFQEQDVKAGTPIMTDWTREVAAKLRAHRPDSFQIGARVYPTEEINLSVGVDVRTMLKERLVDFVVPMVYGHHLLDPGMPIEWLVDAAHDSDVSVYPMLQPYYSDEGRRFHTVDHATPAMMRAAAATYWDRGADGMYTWFLEWPIGDAEREILTELGNPDLVREGDKHYIVARRSSSYEGMGMPAPLPIEIAFDDVGTKHGVPFYVADDLDEAANPSTLARLLINITDLVSADQVSFWLNGQSLEGEKGLLAYAGSVAPYAGQWIEFEMSNLMPRRGENLLEVSLVKRPEGLVGSLIIEDVELQVELHPTAV